MAEPVEIRDVGRILTLPNLLSFARLAGVPLFLWLVLGPRADGWAIIVLAVSGFTDWLDGQLARRLGQVSTLGKLLDPFADRLYILAVLFALTVREIIPLWLAALIILRDVLMAGLLALLRRYGHGPLPVHFLGKAATFCLLYAFPLLFLGEGTNGVAEAARVAGWAFAIWGTGLYWWAGVLYAHQAYQLIRGRTPAQQAEEGRLRT
ncbi:CDP-alcohol phosphatidyltransferase family protein [Actinopolymorpha alba]|uniref:CDP-alcohol phosphatidyltransferase family protein n=1 Tax=Actinopolymorpha alba TaxID=533267 RepID=UPI00036A6238|nr:CDP-alcohol phosphatidyltransferase family protein [Actinopolymorpha alba]